MQIREKCIERWAYNWPRGTSVSIQMTRSDRILWLSQRR